MLIKNDASIIFDLDIRPCKVQWGLSLTEMAQFWHSWIAYRAYGKCRSSFHCLRNMPKHEYIALILVIFMALGIKPKKVPNMLCLGLCRFGGGVKVTSPEMTETVDMTNYLWGKDRCWHHSIVYISWQPPLEIGWNKYVAPILCYLHGYGKKPKNFLPPWSGLCRFGGGLKVTSLEMAKTVDMTDCP